MKTLSARSTGVLLSIARYPAAVRARATPVAAPPWTPAASRVAWPGAPTRNFHGSCRRGAVKPVLLADIGEGIREVQIIQWFVQPGARVEQFDKLCEVSSDKATVEITSRFDGVIKKLYYEADDMAFVGKPLVDIDIQSEISPEDEALTIPPEEAENKESPKEPEEKEIQERPASSDVHSSRQNDHHETRAHQPEQSSSSSGRHATLATPAVRHAAKEHNVEISSIKGSGKDGRVLKEDVHRFASQQKSQTAETPMQRSGTVSSPTTPDSDRSVSLTSNQMAMFRSMTASLSIPHFLYSSTIDLTAINALRQSFKSHPFPTSATPPPGHSSVDAPPPKISLLPFLLKAISLALFAHPILNARLDLASNGPQKPQIRYRAHHNLGVAVDTPNGLLVPVIQSAQNHSILSLASEVQRLGQLARAGKLQPGEMQGGTFTISNIGSVGAGGVVAPVIVEGQTAIVGVGRSRIVPAFGDTGELIKREECILSWSADHRIADGATVARCAEFVREMLEKPERLLVRLK